MPETVEYLIAVRGTPAAVAHLEEVSAAQAKVAATTKSTGAEAAIASSKTTRMTTATGRLGAASKDAEGKIKGAGRGLGVFSSGMGAVVGLLALSAAAHGVVRAFSDQQAAETATTNVLRTTHAVSGMTADSIAKLAVSQAMLTGNSKAAVQQTENLLLTFTKLREAGSGQDAIFTRTTKAALDMSRVFGMNTSMAAKSLGKAMQDPEKGMTALRRAGIFLTAQQTNAIKTMMAHGKQLDAQKFLLGLVEQRVKGAAAAWGRTLPGQIARTKVAATEAGVAFGQLLLPALLKVAQGGLAVMRWFKGLSPEAKKVIIGVVLLAVGLFTLSKIIIGVQSAFGALTALMDAAPALLGPVGIAIMALVVIAVLVITHWQNVKRNLAAVWDWMKTAASDVAGFVTGKFNAVVGFFAGLGGRIWGWMKTAASNVKGFIVGTFNSIVNFIGGLPKRIAAAGAGLFDGLIVGVKAGLNAVIGAINAVLHGAHQLYASVDIPFAPAWPLPDPAIPMLARGGIVRHSGHVIVGERGPEMLDVPAGAMVSPLPAGSMGGWPRGDIVLKVDGREMARVNARTLANAQAAGA